jgi:hypothetical protein
MKCWRCSFLFAGIAILVLAWGILAFAATATLTWNDNSGNPCPSDSTKNCQERGFQVERKTDVCTGTAGTWAKVGDVGPDVKGYVDNTVMPGTTLCYKVRAWNTQCLPGTCKIVNPDGTIGCKPNCTGDLGSMQYSGYSNVAETTIPLVPLSVPVDPSQLGLTSGQ